MDDLIGKIVRIESNNLWGFRTGRVLSCDTEARTLRVQTFDTDIHTVYDENILGFMRDGFFVPIEIPRQIGREVPQIVRFEADNPVGYEEGEVLAYQTDVGTLSIRTAGGIQSVHENNVLGYLRDGVFVPVSPSRQLGREI